MKVIVVALTSLMLIAGCVDQEPLVKQTESGRAEADYIGASSDYIYKSIAVVCAQKGLKVYSSTRDEVVCGQERSGVTGSLTNAVLGGSGSKKPVDKINFHISESNKIIHVWVDMKVETEAKDGKIKSQVVDNNKAINNAQRILNEVK